MKKWILSSFIIWCQIIIFTHAAYSDTFDIPKGKQTELGLYINAKEAYEQWEKNTYQIHILDVRTPEEYILIGHAPMARNIPVRVINQRLTAEKKKLVLESNPNFIAEVIKYYQPIDKIFIMCRSGGRSAMAVNLLKKAGFKFVYNMVDGFEGDTIKDGNSYYNGKRFKNGWKNSGAPWTYNLDSELMSSY